MNAIHVIRLAFEIFGYLSFVAVLLLVAAMKAAGELDRAIHQDRGF